MTGTTVEKEQISSKKFASIFEKCFPVRREM
jgi:hypothetical protein